MKALILAAGKGERLKGLTSDCPKSLIKAAGRPLIDYTIDLLDCANVSEIGVVGGFQFEKLERHLSGRKVATFYNPDFSEGSVRTIMTAIDFLDTDFVLFNADHIYPKKLFGAYLEKMNGLTVACDFDRVLGADDMKIKLGPDGRLTKIRKDLKDFDGGYIGSTFVPKEELENYKKAVIDSYEIYGSKSNAETVVGHLAANGHAISVADLSGFGWLEIDTPEDLKHVEDELEKTL